jgi:Rieske Fe-S protein
MKIFSRRKFLKNFLVFLGLPLSWLWYSTLKKWSDINSKNVITELYDNLPSGISFHDDFIVIKHHKSLKVFSSRCSHLGCKIKNAAGSELVCPCHGSKYNMNGEAVRGPAQKPLSELKFKIDKNKIVVYAS